MRWHRRVAVASSVAILASLATGCANKSEETQRTVAALEGRITALEGELRALKEHGVKTVTIKLKEKSGVTKIVGVEPDKKPLCKEGKLDCPEEIKWVLSGELPTGWSVVIKEKPDSADEGCFKPPSGDSWTITSSGGEAASGKTSCDEGAWWYYDVFLMNGAEQEDHEDPLFWLPFT